MKIIKLFKLYEVFLCECFDYDLEIGILSWKKQCFVYYFKIIWGSKIWYVKFVGKFVGIKQGCDDRLQFYFSIIKLDLYVICVIWLLVMGNDLFDMVIDYINGNLDDN